MHAHTHSPPAHTVQCTPMVLHTWYLLYTHPYSVWNTQTVLHTQTRTHSPLSTRSQYCTHTCAYHCTHTSYYTAVHTRFCRHTCVDSRAHTHIHQELCTDSALHTLTSTRSTVNTMQTLTAATTKKVPAAFIISWAIIGEIRIWHKFFLIAASVLSFELSRAHSRSFFLSLKCHQNCWVMIMEQACLSFT